MKVFALVILLVTCSSSDGLRCATTQDGLNLTESLNGLTSDVLVKKIKGLKVAEYDFDMCRIQFNASYNEEILTVVFSEHLTTKKLSDKNVRTDRYMRGANLKHIHVTHMIEYACSKDLCEIEFIEKYSAFLDWLLDADYSELSNQISLSAVGNGTDQGKCFNQNNVAETCASGYCEAVDATRNDESSQIKQLCVVDKGAIERGAGLTVIDLFDLSFKDINTTVRLRCKFDKCNARNKFKEIKSKFLKVHHIATIFEMLKTETTTLSTKSTISSTSVMNPATTSSVTNPTTTASITNPITTTSVTKSYTNSTMTTTEANNGLHVQSTNTIVYLTLIIFISYWF